VVAAGGPGGGSGGRGPGWQSSSEWIVASSHHGRTRRTIPMASSEGDATPTLVEQPTGGRPPLTGGCTTCSMDDSRRSSDHGL